MKKTLCLIGCDADIKIANALENLGFELLFLPREERLAAPIRSHADTLMFVCKNHIFCEREYIKNPSAAHIFKKLALYGYTVHGCETTLFCDYPKDIAFNAFVLGGRLYANSAFSAKEILDYAFMNDVAIQNLRQGYAKCSTLVLGERAIISADGGIVGAAKQNGIPALQIENSPDSIVLNGYNCGFIGGASGVFEDTVYFTGDISKHPCGEKIADFCKLYNFSVCSLTDEILCDIGGIIFCPPLLP